MIQTSDLWKEIVASQLFSVEWKATIAGVEYDNSSMFNVSIDLPLFDVFSVGNVCSAQLTMSIIQNGDIPKMAEVIPSVRVKYMDKVSEWIDRGKFYIDERDSGQFDSLSITAYDSALLSEVGFLDPGEEIDYEWPATPNQVIGTIMSKLGVELDPRTVLSDEHIVQFTDPEISCRTMASHIAAAHAGNWVVTSEGKWLLLTFDMIPQATSYLIDEAGSPITFGEVRLLV